MSLVVLIVRRDGSCHPAQAHPQYQSTTNGHALLSDYVSDSILSEVTQAVAAAFASSELESATTNPCSEKSATIVAIPLTTDELCLVVRDMEYRHVAEATAGSDHSERLTDVLSRLASLTRREQEVMNRISSGKTVKQIASEFGVSGQTAAKHRARVLAKLKVENDVELVRLLMAADQLD